MGNDVTNNKKEAEVRKLYDSNNFGDFTEFSVKREDNAQEIAKNVNTNYLNLIALKAMV